MEAVRPECRELEAPIELSSNEGIKTLGLLWHPSSDQFSISKGACAQVLQETKPSHVTKCILSIVATIFDSLGLINPIVSYKMFLQQLWLHKLDLDDQLSLEFLKHWVVMYLHLFHVNKITVDRLVLSRGQPVEI